VLAASTREGEEAMLLGAWRSVAAPAPLLLIVPRHPQRFDAVAELVGAAGLALARRSGWDDAPGPDAQQAAVWLGDSMREMPAYYALADVALLGGSFAPLGGQNLIEAAACGCPVVMGPHTFNFAEAASLALDAGAATRVADMQEGVATAAALVAADGAARRETQARQARQFAAEHRGSAARMAARIVAAIDAGERAAR
jgi:3-deoxy-D-manno-octulosonic-acid transferase